MDFKKRKIHSLHGLIALVVITLQAAASTNINCDGRAFHCVNSTHFIICVDIGGGQSKTIDNFIIPCPPTTECKMNNRLECEFPPAALPVVLFEPLKSTIRATVADTTILPQNEIILSNTESPQNVSEILTDGYFNTVSPTTVSEKRINTSEETFTVSVKTINDINGSTVVPQLTTRYIDNEFMPNKNVKHSTMKPIQDKGNIRTTTEKTLYDFSSLQSIDSVTDATIDKKTSPDFLEYAAQNKVDYFNNETNKQSTLRLYVTGSIQSSTLGQIDINTTKMTEFIHFNISELNSINDSKNITSIIDEKDATLKTLLTTNAMEQNYSGLLANDEVTMDPNINTKSNITSYILPIQSSSIDKVVTNADITTETVIPIENKVTFASTGIEVSTKKQITIHGTEKNCSDLLSNKLTTTLPNTYTTYVINKFDTKPDNTTEKVISTPFVTEFLGSAVNVTTYNLPATDSAQQKHSHVFSNNIEITNSNNVPSHNESINKTFPTQNSSTNRDITMPNATIETTVSEITSANSRIDITSETKPTTDILKRNISEIITNDIMTTVPNNVISYDESTNTKLSTQSSSIHENVIMPDNTRETTVSIVTETVSVKSEIGATSETQFTTGIFKENYSDIITNNQVTVTPNIVKSSDVSKNKLSTQNLSINEAITKSDATIETTSATETETNFIKSGMGLTSASQFTTDVSKDNYSDINTNNMMTITPDNVTSYNESTNTKSSTPSSSIDEIIIMPDATMETTVSTVNETASLKSGMGVTSETQNTTVVYKDTYSDIITNNKVTTAPNVVTSPDVSRNKSSTQNLSINEAITKSNATIETTSATVTETNIINSGMGLTSASQFTTDVLKENYSDLNTNNIVTIAPDNVTSYNESTNTKSSTQSSSIDEIVIMPDATMETTVSTVNETASLKSGMGVTSETQYTTVVYKDTYSDIITNNKVTTAPNVVTSPDVSRNKSSRQNLSINEAITKSDPTIETTSATVTETDFINSGIGLTSETQFTTDVLEQNYSEIITNNMVTIAPDNVTSYNESRNIKSLTQSSIIHEIVIMPVNTMETTVSIVTETASVISETGITSETHFTTGVFKENDSDIITNNTVTTAANVVTSPDVSRNKPSTQNSNINEAITKSDATIETTTAIVTEQNFINSGIGFTSASQFTTDVLKENYSDINTHNMMTIAPDNITSYNESINTKSSTQTSSIDEIVIMPDTAMETTVSTVSETASLKSGMGVTSETQYTTVVYKDTYSHIITNNKVTTAPNVVTSPDVSRNKSSTQNLSINEAITKSDPTIETTSATVTETNFIKSGMGLTSASQFTTDVIKVNYSDLNTNNMVTIAPHNVTSYNESTNTKSSTQSSSIDEIVIMPDATMETTVSTVSETASLKSGMGVTSETQYTTVVFKEAYSDIITNNKMTTAPNIVTSPDVSRNKSSTQNLSINEAITKSDPTIETTSATVTETDFINSGIGLTSETQFTTDVLEQNYSDLNTNNMMTIAPDNVTSYNESRNIKSLTQSSSIHEIVIMPDTAMETTVSIVTETASVISEMGITSETHFTTGVFKENDSDIITNNKVTTAPNFVANPDVSRNKSSTQNSSINVTTTKSDATIETTTTTVTETNFINSGMDFTSETQFTTDVLNENYSDMIKNDKVTIAPNNVTSYNESTNTKSSASLNTNEVVSDAIMEITVFPVTETAFINTKMDITSEAQLTTDVFEQNYSDSIINNIVTTAPYISTSSDVLINNKLPIQSENTNEVVTMLDATFEMTVSAVTKAGLLDSGMRVTTETQVTTDDLKQNYTDIITNNIETITPNIVESSNGSININSSTERSNIYEAITMPDTIAKTTVSIITEIASVSNALGVTSETQYKTDTFKQNYLDKITNNVVTIAPNFVTTFDVSTNNKLSTQTSSTNEVITMVGTATKSTVSSTTETGFVNSGIDVTFKTLFSEESIKKNYSDITSNNIVTNISNVFTGFDINNNVLPIQGSSINEVFATPVDNIEITVSTVTETASVSSKNAVTSKSLATPLVIKQNHSDIIANNTATTDPNIGMTNSDNLTNKKLPNYINEFVTIADEIEEAIISTVTVTEPVSNAEPFKESSSDIVINNTASTVPNIVTSSDESLNQMLSTKMSNTNEVVTLVDATTNTMTPTVTATVSVSNAMDITSETLFTTETLKESSSDIITNNMASTVPNIVASSDESLNQMLSTKMSNTNEVVTLVDATTNTMTPTVTATVSVSNAMDVTSETLFTTETLKESSSDIITNNMASTVPNIVASSDESLNQMLSTKMSNTNEVVTLVDATTNTMTPTVTATVSVSNAMDVTSETLFTTETLKESSSDIITNNMASTVPNIVASSDESLNQMLSTKMSNTNEVVTLVDATTNTMTPTVTATVSVSNAMDVTSETLFTTETLKESSSDIITNNMASTVPNIVASSDESLNQMLSTKMSNTNEVVTLVDATTNTMTPTVTATVSVSNAMDVTSETLLTTETLKESSSDIITNNMASTVPNIVASSDESLNQMLSTKMSNTNEVVTLVDATTNTMTPTVTATVSVSNAMDVTSETLLTTETLKESSSDIITNNMASIVPNIVASSDESLNQMLSTERSNTNKVVTLADITTKTMTPTATATVSVSNAMDVFSETLFTTETFKQDYSNIVTTVPNIVTNSYATNKISKQSSSIHEVSNMADSTMETVVSTVIRKNLTSTEMNDTSGNLNTTHEVQQNVSGYLNKEIMTTYINIANSSYVTENEVNVSTQSLNMNEVVANVKVNTEIIIPTEGEIISTSTDTNEFTEILSAMDIDQQHSFNSLPNEILTIQHFVTNQYDSNYNTMTVSMENEESFINSYPTSTSNWYTKAHSELMFNEKLESEVVDELSSDVREKEEYIQAIPSVIDLSLSIINKTSSTSITDINVIPTTNKRLVTTDASLEIEENQEFSGTDTIQKYLSISLNNSFDVSHITNEPTTERRENNTSPDNKSIDKQISSVNTRGLVINKTEFSKNDSTDDGHLNMTLPGKEHPTTTTSLLITPIDEYVSQTGIQNENIQTMNSNIHIYNTSNKYTDNMSKISTKTQSKQSNMSNEKQGKSSKFNNTQKNSDNNKTFTCRHRSRGRYADDEDCRKFYICIGREQPIVGMCPFGTVFSEIRKQCTNNLSHCIRNHQFHCTSEGRFSEFLQSNVYYICIEDESDKFLRFKLQCQNGYYLNKTSVLCSRRIEESSQSDSSSSDSSKTQSATKSSSDDSSSTSESSVFQCKREGKFADPSNCRRYYVCSKSHKLGYKIKRKFCDDDQIFDNRRKKCVDDDSFE